jgi:sugar (pentulose or hexulose) kinase
MASCVKDAILLIDFGTSGEKWTLLVRENHGTRSGFSLLAALKNAAEPDKRSGYGEHEWNPGQFVDRMVRIALRANLTAHQNGCRIAGMCATSTTSSIVTMRGTRLLPSPPAIRWDDRRAAESAVEVERLRQSTGAAPWMTIAPDSALARAHFLWLRQPEDLADPELCLVEQLSLFGLFWTGKLSIAESIAARKWGFTRKRPWPKAFRKGLAELLGASDGQPPDWLMGRPTAAAIIGGGEVVGEVLPTLTEFYGFERTSTVIAAPYDTLSQVLGMGLLHLRGAAAVSLGTSMGVCALDPKWEERSLTPYGPLPEMPVPGFGILFDGLSSCGSALELIGQMAAIDRSADAPDWTWVSDALIHAEPGSRGVRVVPYFSVGRRALTGARPPTSIIEGYAPGLERELVRALFEALGYHIRLMVESFEGVLGSRIECIAAGGGMANSSEFMRMLANITGRKVLVSNYRDSALLGCGICGALGLRWFTDAITASREIVGCTTEMKESEPGEPDVSRYDVLYKRYCADFKL